MNTLALAPCLELWPLQHREDLADVHNGRCPQAGRPLQVVVERMEDVLPPPAAKLVEIDDDLETEAEGVKLLTPPPTSLPLAPCS